MSSQFQVVNLRPLSQGGNGSLFLGQRSDNGAHVVVKYLRECNSPGARKCFLREVRVLLREYRGLVRLLAWDTDGERPYYVMPYLSGGPLTKHAHRLSGSQMVAVATELAITLSDVHAKFDAHGDLKPDNILISEDGRLQVADPLGNGVTCTIVFAKNHGGTPGYWAPEVKAGGPISAAGDVYSYGATLYHLATGQRPVDGQRLDMDLSQYAVSPKIREVIVACCQWNQKERPRMIEVLRILRGEQWSDIRVAQKRVQGLVVAGVVIAGIAFLGAALSE